MVNVLAVPVLTGRKTERERFSGATTTWTCEAMMRDGKALQMGTSHELGQNFARVFDTTFLDESGHETLVWQTSWGASSRLMGALVMAHGDDAGLRVPPSWPRSRWSSSWCATRTAPATKPPLIAADLADAGLRTQLDGRTDTSFGRRVVDWELKGVPVRVEVGPRELAAGEAVLVRRDSGTKTTVPLDGLETAGARRARRGPGGAARRGARAAPRRDGRGGHHRRGRRGLPHRLRRAPAAGPRRRGRDPAQPAPA